MEIMSCKSYNTVEDNNMNIHIELQKEKLPRKFTLELNRLNTEHIQNLNRLYDKFLLLNPSNISHLSISGKSNGFYTSRSDGQNTHRSFDHTSHSSDFDTFKLSPNRSYI